MLLTNDHGRLLACRACDLGRALNTLSPCRVFISHSLRPESDEQLLCLVGSVVVFVGSLAESVAIRDELPSFGAGRVRPGFENYKVSVLPLCTSEAHKLPEELSRETTMECEDNVENGAPQLNDAGGADNATVLKYEQTKTSSSHKSQSERRSPDKLIISETRINSLLNFLIHLSEQVLNTNITDPYKIHRDIHSNIPVCTVTHNFTLRKADVFKKIQCETLLSAVGRLGRQAAKERSCKHKASDRKEPIYSGEENDSCFLDIWICNAFCVPESTRDAFSQLFFQLFTQQTFKVQHFAIM